MKNLTIKKVFWTWFAIDLVLMFINGATVKSSLLASIVHATLGVFLLINPIYPENIKNAYGEEKSRQIMRILGALEIVASFLLKTNF